MCNAGRPTRGARCWHRGGGGIAVGPGHKRRDGKGHASRGGADVRERRGCQGTVDTYRGQPTWTVVVATLDLGKRVRPSATRTKTPSLLCSLARPSPFGHPQALEKLRGMFYTYSFHHQDSP